MKPEFFASVVAFDRWLAEHGEGSGALWVGFHRVATGRPSMTWEESVEVALRHGWIDGVRKRVDEGSYAIRFTPRAARSNWSAKNLRTVERLIEEGRMTPAGLRAYERRPAQEAPAYSFERAPARLPPDLQLRLEASDGWAHFAAQPAGYRTTLLHWVASAKREDTRARRLDRLIEVSSQGGRVNLASPFADP